jgi:predicted DNA-binding transcriptional regulator AlpA
MTPGPVAQSHADPDALLRPEEAARLLGYTTRALEAWRMQGRGPAFVRVSKRSVRYRRGDLLAWAASRVCRSTSDGAGAGA